LSVSIKFLIVEITSFSSFIQIYSHAVSVARVSFFRSDIQQSIEEGAVTLEGDTQIFR